MRQLRTISDEERNVRLEVLGTMPHGATLTTLRQDPVEPEPVGTVVAVPFRIVGYDRDCDGSLMARLVAVDADGDATGWEQDAIGLEPDAAVVLEDAGELFRLGTAGVRAPR